MLPHPVTMMFWKIVKHTQTLPVWLHGQLVPHPPRRDQGSVPAWRGVTQTLRVNGDLGSLSVPGHGAGTHPSREGRAGQGTAAPEAPCSGRGSLLEHCAQHLFS